MKLFQFNKRYDFGHEIYFSFLTLREYSLLQVSFDYNDIGGWPYLQISSGYGRTFSLLLTLWRLGFCLDLLARSWNWCYDTNITLDELRNGN
jgi:hypothetical protein